jgi:hypothetical protein
MLAKLLKYEFKDTARIIPILYLCVAVIAAIAFVAKQTKVALFSTTSIVFLVIAGVALTIVTAILLIIRFYKSLYSNEGYLMFTIPVKPHMLLTAKSKVAVIWLTFSTIICFAIVFLTLHLTGAFSSSEFNEFWSVMKQHNFDMLLTLFIPLSFLSVVWFVCQVFFAITLSNLSVFHKMGVGAAILIYIVMYILLQIIGSIFAFLVPCSLMIGSSGVSLKFINMIGYLKDSYAGKLINDVPIGLGNYIFVIIMTFVLFYINGRLMNRKVSLR